MDLPAEDRVHRRAIAVLENLQRVEEAALIGNVYRKDIDFAVTSAVILFTQEIENQLQRLFVQLVMGNRQLPNVRPIVGFRSASILHKNLRGDQPFAKWLPYPVTVKRARRYLAGGRPFTVMQNRHYLSDLQTIRNEVAHASPDSRRQFQKRIIEGRPIPTYERSVIRYLRGNATATESRLENHLKNAVKAFQELV